MKINDNVKYILILFVVILTIIGIVFFNSKNSDSNNKNDSISQEEQMDDYYSENRDKVNLELGKNIESKGYILEDGDLLLEISNLNDYLINAIVYVEFFDGNGDFITIEDAYFSAIAPGKKCYNSLYLSDELRALYETYQIRVVPTYDSYARSYYDQVKNISLDEKKEIISFEIDADTNDKIDVEFGLFYYDENGNIIDFSRKYYGDVAVNKKIKEDIYLRYDSYDKVEAVLLYATSDK